MFTLYTLLSFDNGIQTPEFLSVSKTAPKIGKLKVKQTVVND